MPAAPPDEPTVEIIHPPNALKARVGARFAAVDPVAIARAEAALKALSSEFPAWMAEETARLDAARRRLDADDAAAAWEALHLRAHDLKGLGSTYGYPLATRICASLCRLLDAPAARASTSRVLVDAHVDAVRALLRDEARPASAATAEEVCDALEARTAETLVQRAA